MKKLLLFTLFAVLAAAAGWGTTVTFLFNSSDWLAGRGIAVPTTNNGTNLTEPFTYESITFSCTSGSTATRIWNSSGTLELRFYKNGSITFSAASNISKIVFSGDKIGVFTADSGTYSNGTWTGNANSVTFTASNTAEVSTVVLTIADDAPPAAPTFTPASGASAEGSITVEMSSTTSGADIHYTTDGTDPTASSPTGTRVTFNTVGSHTLKAIAVNNGLSSSVTSGTYTVTAPSGGDAAEYVLVTDASTLAEGDKVIIVNQEYSKAMSTTQNSNNRGATTIILNNTVATANESTQVLTLEGSSAGWYFNTGSGYLYAASSSNNYLKTQPGKNDNAKAEISISNGEATIKFLGSNTHNLLRYNNGSTLFSCYASGQQPVSLYRQAVASATPVEGLAAMNALDEGTLVRLYLPDEESNNKGTRVLHAHQTAQGVYDVYVRDLDGTAAVLKGITPNRTMAYNQHLGGYITGTTGTTPTGMPMLDCSGDVTNTAMLVIADRVTETNVMPKAITADQYGSHLADWVSLTDLDASEVSLSNEFGIGGFGMPYSGSVFDLNGIVAGDDGTIYPLGMTDLPWLTYVVKPAGYTAPANDLSGVSVRLDRTLRADVWTPLVLPFRVTGFHGTIMRYKGLTASTAIGESQNSYDAGQMEFEATDVIEPGVPYLVRPDIDITSLTVSGVTLTSADPTTVTYSLNGPVNASPRRVMTTADEYSLVGTYQSITVATDRTAKVFDEAGNVGWADDSNSTVDGTYAYILSPADQSVKLNLGGEEGIITGVRDVKVFDEVPREGVFNILGMEMKVPLDRLPAGIYIVNGKKVVKQ